jgi:hypothetical protein
MPAFNDRLTDEQILAIPTCRAEKGLKIVEPPPGPGFTVEGLD